MLKHEHFDKRHRVYPEEDDEPDEFSLDPELDIDIAPRGWESLHGEQGSEDPIDAPHYPAWCDDEDDRCPAGPRFQGDHPSMEAPEWREPLEHGVPVEQYTRGRAADRFHPGRDTASSPTRHPAQGPDAEQALARGRYDYDLPRGGRTAPNPADATEDDRYVPAQASAKNVGGQKSQGGATRESKTKREERESIPAKENLGGRAQSYGGGRTAQHPREEEKNSKQ